MRYVLALIIFIMTSANVMASQSQSKISFSGMITEAACSIVADHGNIHSSCAGKNERRVSDFHISSAEDGQHFVLPGNAGHMKLKWLNSARNKGLLIASYR